MGCQLLGRLGRGCRIGLVRPHGLHWLLTTWGNGYVGIDEGIIGYRCADAGHGWCCVGTGMNPIPQRFVDKVLPFFKEQFE